ncbi:MAG TPA: hypothetical protein VHK70_01550 [Burkholderiaceae bacterium]|jgi:hypothetical protein|nr:hypothetical protein [Burkholderiaceae bacterium]
MTLRIEGTVSGIVQPIRLNLAQANELPPGARLEPFVAPTAIICNTLKHIDPRICF